MMKRFYNINEGFDFDSEEGFDFGHDIELHNSLKTFEKVEKLLDMAMFLYKEHLLMDGQDLIDENYHNIFKLYISVFPKDQFKRWAITLYDRFSPICKLVKLYEEGYKISKLNGRNEVTHSYEMNEPLPIELSRHIDSTYNKVKALVENINPEKLRKDFFDFGRSLTRKNNFSILSSKLYPEFVSYASDKEIYFNDKGIRTYGIETISSSHSEASIYGEIGNYIDKSFLIQGASTSTCTKEELVDYIVKYVNPYRFYQFRDKMMEALPEIFVRDVNEAFDFDSEDDDAGGISDRVKSHAEIARFQEFLAETSTLVKQWSANGLADSFYIGSNNIQVTIYPDYYIIHGTIDMNGQEDTHISLSSNDFSPIMIKVRYDGYVKFTELSLESKLGLMNLVKNVNITMKEIIDNPQEIKRMLSKIHEVKEFLESAKMNFWYSDCPYISTISGTNSRPTLNMESEKCGIYGIVRNDENSYKVLFNYSFYTDYAKIERLDPILYKSIDFDSAAKTIMESKSAIKSPEVQRIKKECIEEGLKTNEDCQNLLKLFISLKNAKISYIEFPGFTITGFGGEDTIRFKDALYIANSDKIKEKDGHLSIYNVHEIFGISKSAKEAKNKILALFEESIPKSVKYSKPTLVKFEKIVKSFKSPIKIKMKRGIFCGTSEGFAYCLKTRNTLAFYKGNLYFGGKPKQMENIIEEILQYFSGEFEEISTRDTLIRERLVETLKDSFVFNESSFKIRLGAISGKFCSLAEGNAIYGIKVVSGRLDFYRDTGSPLGVKVIALNVPPTEKTKDIEKAFELMLDTIPNSIDGKIPSNYKNIFYDLISYYD